MDDLILETKESPREIIEADFKSLRAGFPIRGGWGYSKNDPCIIDKSDPVVDQTQPFNGVGLEYVFVEKRIYEELIIFRPKGQQFCGIRWELSAQNLVHEHGRVLDHLLFNVFAFYELDWDELKAEYEGPNGVASSAFDADAHARKRDQKMVRLVREFWFDVTSFFGK